MPQKEVQLGIKVKKDKDFSEWYNEVVIKGELADHSVVRGFMVIKPRGYAVWEKIQSYFDEKIKKSGVKNAYFPLLIPESFFKKEAKHAEGFAPELAWVMDEEQKEKYALRPTSETIMYDSYSKWIRSWRDLPLRLNQWNSVVRWEFKHPAPFLRTREFLWNEGHTAFATKEEADKEIGQILGIWKDIVFNYMALYGVIGKKSDKEKFAGAIATYAMELIMPNGRIIQGPDAHSDGQNFAKAYNIKFVDRDEKEKHVWQNTWAITTRMIGVMAAIHSDDKGLVLPPMIAPTKIVIVPIYKEDTRKDVVKEAKKIAKKLQPFGACLDDRDEYSPGWKFNEWELKGVPLRIEIGPRDIENKSVTAVRRDNGKKEAIPVENLPKRADEILKDIQNGLFARSKAQFESRVSRAKNMEEFTKSIEEKNIVLADFCGEEKCEDAIKDKSGGASSAVTVEESNGACFNCGKKAKHVFYFGKGY